MALSLLAMTSQPAFAQDEKKAMSMSELLRQVEQGRVTDNKENKAREARFAQAKTEQQKLLNEAKGEKGAAESRSQQLENDFEANDQADSGPDRDALNATLGSLKELFGVMQQVSGDCAGAFRELVDAYSVPRSRGIPGSDLAKKIGSSAKLPSLEEIERLVVRTAARNDRVRTCRAHCDRRHQ